MPTQIPKVGEDVTSLMPPVGADVTQLMGSSANFQAGNEKDASGNATVDPNTLGTFARHLWAGINPAQLGQLLPWPKRGGGSGVDNPLFPQNILKGMMSVKKEADDAMDRGDHITAITKYVESFIPMLGKWMSDRGNQLQRGEYAAAAGDIIPVVAMTAIGAGGSPEIQTPALMRNANSAERAAVSFGEQRGIPIDAATATGNRFVRGTQQIADQSMAGSVVGGRARAAQETALTDTGRSLAAEAGPPSSPIDAAESASAAVTEKVRQLSSKADDAYTRLRTLEQNSNPETRAAYPADPQFQSMRLAVDLRPAKQGLTSLYERLKREAELVPLQGGKARALTALDRLMSGPDFQPLSIVDEALGDLKDLARTTDIPELRTKGQGVAAHAVSQLGDQVLKTATDAGPDVLTALQEGRSATVEKYAVAKVRESLFGKDASKEPGSVFNGLTADNDLGLSKLRQLQSVAPDQVPLVGRAVLEDMLKRATAEGGFMHTDRLFADWGRLGNNTKALLFPDASLRSSLDNFFLLAKKIGENPNPSGSALSMMKGGELAAIVYDPWVGLPTSLGLGTLSKMLHSPAVVRALTQGLRLRLDNAPAAAQVTVANNVIQAARKVGVQLTPAVASERQQEQP